MRPEQGRRVCISDSVDRFVAVSEGYASLLGYKPEELVGRSTLDVLDMSADVVRRRIEDLDAIGRQADTTALIHKDGTRIPIAYRVETVHSRGEPFHVTVVTPEDDGDLLPKIASLRRWVGGLHRTLEQLDREAARKTGQEKLAEVFAMSGERLNAISIGWAIAGVLDWRLDLDYTLGGVLDVDLTASTIVIASAALLLQRARRRRRRELPAAP